MFLIRYNVINFLISLQNKINSLLKIITLKNKHPWFL